MVRFLHTSDWQLGMRKRFLSNEAQDRFAQERIDAVRRVAALAHAEAAEFVVVAGDVFESNQVNRSTVLRAMDALSAFDVPVVLLPGNHDTWDAASVFASPVFLEKRSEHVFVHTGDGPLVLPGVSGVEIYGAPWRSKRPLTDLVADCLAEIPETSDGIARVLIAHGAVDSLSPDRTDPARIRLAPVEAAIAAGRLHYLALGDRHSTTDVGSTGRVWYSGAHVATDYDEDRPGQVLVVDLDAGGPATVRALPVAPDEEWRFLDQRFELSSHADVERLVEWLDAVERKERAIVQLSLVGSIGLAAKARLDTALEEAAEAFASVRLWNRHTELVVLPEDLATTDLGLSGYAQEAWEELSQAAASGDAEAVDALALFYRLAGGGQSA